MHRARYLAPAGCALVGALLAHPILAASPAAPGSLRDARASRLERRAATAPTAAGPVGPAPTSANPLAPDKSAIRTRLGTTTPAAVGVVAPASASAGPIPMACESLSFLLDGFGGLGSSTYGTNPLFVADDAEPARGTIFELMAHVPGAGFLEGSALSAPPSDAHARLDGLDVVAAYEVGGWRVDVRTRLLDCGPGRATLAQEWSLTNVGPSDRALPFTSYLDADLLFRGTANDDLAARHHEELVIFDEGLDRANPTAYVALAIEAPGAGRVTREIGEFSEQRQRIQRGGPVLERSLRADGSQADADADDVTDLPFDATVAARADFGLVPPGATRTVVVTVRWGVGSVDDLLSNGPVADAGPDRVLECEGAAGTLARLDAGASPSPFVAWTWSVDGAIVSDAQVADVLLFPGVHVVALEAVDALGRVAQDDARLEVVDSLAPAIDVTGHVVLWPPDHRLVEVALPATARDACTDSVRVRPIAVSCDEPADVGRSGDGRTPADAVVTLDGRLFVRAERQGGGDGRVYRVICSAVDSAGNESRADVVVEVPHEPGTPAIDSGTASAVRP